MIDLINAILLNENNPMVNLSKPQFP